jgi:phosphoribosyl 1,2-cyclic phosphodiesterase
MITVEVLGSSSKGNCYRLLSGGRSLLLECGLPWKEIRRGLNFQTTALDGCLITHHHKDHARSAADVMRAGVDLYATGAAFEAMAIPGGPHHRFKPLIYRHTVTVGEWWRVMAFEAHHDAPGTAGFLIEDKDGDKLVFLTDSAFSYYTFPGTGVYMVEANFSEKILQRNVDDGLIDAYLARRVTENHMSIERVVVMFTEADLSQCRHIHLLHGSDGNSDSALFKKIVEETTGVPVTVEG